MVNQDASKSSQQLVGDPSTFGKAEEAAFLASNRLPLESNNCVLRRLIKQFVAILAGNLLYFFVLMPHLPPAGRHIPYRIDLGLLVDLWVCLVLYGIVEWFDRKRLATRQRNPKR